jgi:UDP-N-acetylglucosamine 2-epimerase (non-hydrolysing)
MKKILLVAGARPNFMKIAPIMRELEKRNYSNFKLIHTGQHYGNMSKVFFESLDIKEPYINLNVGSGTHASQTARIMMEFHHVCIGEEPYAVVVVGDVNSTVAAGLVAKKLGIMLCHVEAGLRSFDRTMPEEINRIVTDSISDILFVSEMSGSMNLTREGHREEEIYYVGNVMIDNMLHQVDKIKNGTGTIDDRIKKIKDSLPEKYLCMTLHRPSNVDDKETLTGIMEDVKMVSELVPVVFPVHPRTAESIKRFGLELPKKCICLDPLGYDDFLYLWMDSSGVITDSGGLQEETTALKKPCITLRHNTERPSTEEIGSNVVIGNDNGSLMFYVDNILNGKWKKSAIPQFWDGRSSERIVDILENL